MILHRYFARRFLITFLATTGVFAIFLAMLDLIEQVRRFGSDQSLGGLVRLTLLNLPEALSTMLPLIMILSSIALFMALSRSSELVVARAVGRSGLTILAAPAAVALLIGLVSLAVGNPIIAATSARYQIEKEALKSGEADAFSVGREGLWLRQGSAEGPTVIHAARANADASVLYDVSFVIYTKAHQPDRRITARSAQLTAEGWEVTNATEWSLAPGSAPDETRRQHDELRLPSTLTAEEIRDRFSQPSAVGIWDLPAHIEGLRASGFSARRHVVWFQMELARPLFLVAMVLVGAGFTMGHARIGRRGVMVLAAVMTGFALYYVRSFAQILGDNGQIPPALAAWAPPVAALFMALGLILHREDG